MYYTAFYTNCERELSQVTRGRLLTLVYSLQRAKSSPRGRVSIGGINMQMEAAGRSQRQMPDSMTKSESREWLEGDSAFFSPASCGGGGGGGGTGAGAFASSPTEAMAQSVSGKVGLHGGLSF